MKLYVATPSYDGKVTCSYANSLVRTYMACGIAGIEVCNDLKIGCCYVDFARNWLVHRFLQSDADSLLFVDADMGWDENAVVRLYQSPFGIAGGVYPMKQDRPQYPIELLGPQSDGFVEAKYLPTGFMLVKRAVFDHLAARADIPLYKDAQSGEMVYSFFQCIPNAEGYTGEDTEFCNRWRKIGGRVWCLPSIDFEHQGIKIWSGNYGEFLGKIPLREAA